MAAWFSLFNNWETFAGQFLALALVVGSYFGAQYLRVWRPRRQGRLTARVATQPPEPAADLRRPRAAAQPLSA